MWGVATYQLCGGESRSYWIRVVGIDGDVWYSASLDGPQSQRRLGYIQEAWPDAVRVPDDPDPT